MDDHKGVSVANANNTATTHSLDVSATEKPAVGVCLCGGGSRAMVAGMGQLRALRHLGLLDKTAYLSTVSGGSWVGATYQFLKPDVSEDEYLNRYVADPAQLVLHKTAASLPQEQLDYLPPKNIGAQINRGFSAIDLALEAAYLGLIDKVPSHQIWQTLIGRHILKPYGLYSPGMNQLPTGSFTYNQKSLESIFKQNPSLTDVPFHLFADSLSPKAEKRPQLLCNFAMFVRTDDSGAFGDLAPVHSNALNTGMPGRPPAYGVDNIAPGGGGVSNFGFNSILSNADTETAVITQPRPWALEDVIGTSSAFFAEMIERQLNEWRRNPDMMMAHMQSMGGSGMQKFAKSAGGNGVFQKLLRQLTLVRRRFKFLLRSEAHYLANRIRDLGDVIPEYYYWPIPSDGQMPQETSSRVNRFADGGNLENTGIAALLSCSDVSRVISFINSTTPISAAAYGVFDVDQNEISDSRYIVDSQIPPLFGYRPYDKAAGYRRFETTDATVNRFNQVFEASAFAPFLRALCSAAGANGTDSVAIAKLSVAVVDNPWFNVKARPEVQLLLVYTTKVGAWYDALNSDVQQFLGDFDDASAYSRFPYYDTVTKTELDPYEVNLLANLTAWSAASGESATLIKSMYKA